MKLFLLWMVHSSSVHIKIGVMMLDVGLRRSAQYVILQKDGVGFSLLLGGAEEPISWILLLAR